MQKYRVYQEFKEQKEDEDFRVSAPPEPEQ